MPTNDQHFEVRRRNTMNDRLAMHLKIELFLNNLNNEFIFLNENNEIRKTFGGLLQKRIVYHRS